MTALAPVTPRERIMTLDVLRGFALLGVDIGNTFWLYSARAWEHPRDTSRLDRVAQVCVALLVDSKAQTLLTLLFGFGFAAPLLRAEERQQPIGAIPSARSMSSSKTAWRCAATRLCCAP
jgi:uncharacterized protein